MHAVHAAQTGGLRPPAEHVLAPLSDAERASVRPRPGVATAGVHRALPAGIHRMGGWDVSPDGRPVWRLAIRSPGAAAIRVHFTDFAAGQGKVWVHSAIASRLQRAQGPYTGRGLFERGDFWSGLVFGESAIVEYEPAAAASPGSLPAAPPFHMVQVSHIWDSRLLPPVAAGSKGSSSANQSTSAPLTAPCELDVSCEPVAQALVNAVALIFFESGAGAFACSGSLLDSSVIRPFFLTANHCISDNDTAGTVAAIWFYQTQACFGPPPDISLSPMSFGATLLANGPMAEGDFSLLQLSFVPGGVPFAPWSLDEPPIGSAVFGIHHPETSYKRVFFGTRIADETVDVEGSIAPADKFYQVLITRGWAEPGSSGSPLFDASGRVAGTLTAGDAPDPTICNIPNPQVTYGRLSTAYASLQSYLGAPPQAPAASLAITAVSPSQVVAGQDVDLTVTGSGFVAGTSVTIVAAAPDGSGSDTITAPAAILSATSLTFTLPGYVTRDPSWDVAISAVNSGNGAFSNRLSLEVHEPAPTAQYLIQTVAQLPAPQYLASDGLGNIYVSDSQHHQIWKIAAATKAVSVFAGTGAAGGSGDGGPAASAGFAGPYGLAFAPPGNLYVADGCRVRKIAADTQVISTIAGTGTCGTSGDGGAATSAQVNASRVAVAASGDLYIQQPDEVRTVSAASGIITMVANPDPLVFDAVDSNGAYYFSSGARVLKLGPAPDGRVPIAGNGQAGFSGDGGAAILAMLNEPGDVALSRDGTIYIADTGNDRVRALTSPLGSTVTPFVNAASYISGPIAPGEIVTILASGLGAPATPVVGSFDASGHLPTVLSGGAQSISIEFDRTPAPLLYASDTQISAIVPYEVQDKLAVQVYVRGNG